MPVLSLRYLVRRATIETYVISLIRGVIRGGKSIDILY